MDHTFSDVIVFKFRIKDEIIQVYTQMIVKDNERFILPFLIPDAIPIPLASTSQFTSYQVGFTELDAIEEKIINECLPQQRFGWQYMQHSIEFIDLPKHKIIDCFLPYVEKNGVPWAVRLIAINAKKQEHFFYMKLVTIADREYMLPFGMEDKTILPIPYETVRRFTKWRFKINTPAKLALLETHVADNGKLNLTCWNTLTKAFIPDKDNLPPITFLRSLISSWRGVTFKSLEPDSVGVLNFTDQNFRLNTN